jgi:tetratricopeptide (TPR) repeat protein
MLYPQVPWKYVFTCSFLALAAAAVEAQETPGIRWRTDYNTARKEAEAKKLPMLIDFITEPCGFCHKMDQTTFSDPRVANMINERFIPLKINNKVDEKLARAVNIGLFPTIVLAGPDGLILKSKIGWHPADELHEMMQETLASLAPPDAMQERYRAAKKMEEGGDYVQAISTLRDILADGKGRPIQNDAQELLKNIDRRAELRLAKAKEFQDKGLNTEAHEAYTEIAKEFAGAAASRKALDLRSALDQANKELPVLQRNKRASDLLVQAQGFYTTKDYVLCLDRCDKVLQNYGDLPEGLQAHALAKQIRSNPQWMQNASDALGEQLCGIWLAIADNHLKQGELQRAEYWLRKVMNSFPGTRLAESAQIRLNQLQGTVPTSNSVAGP